MEINVSELLKEPIGSTRIVDVDEPVESEDIGACPIKGKVKLTRTNRSILVKGDLTTDVTLTCARCLAPVDSCLQLQFEEEFFPSIDILTGKQVDVPEEDAFAIDERHVIDLDETIREYILMATPMKPLCRSDCAGLCPGCGADLNKNRCRCSAGAGHPAFQALKDEILDKSGKE